MVLFFSVGAEAQREFNDEFQLSGTVVGLGDSMLLLSRTPSKIRVGVAERGGGGGGGGGGCCLLPPPPPNIFAAAALVDEELNNRGE
jgi:hypothetical protein